MKFFHSPKSQIEIAATTFRPQLMPSFEIFCKCWDFNTDQIDQRFTDMTEYLYDTLRNLLGEIDKAAACFTEDEDE
jgi:hypothetical protein